MSLYCLVNGKYIPLISYTSDQKIDEAGSFSIEIPVSDIDLESAKNSNISIYFNNSLINSGFIFERISLSIDSTGILKAKIKCYDELARLTLEPAYSTFHAQDAIVKDVIDNLLISTSFTNWTSRVVNFPNVDTETITIDLRGKETIFAQLVEVVKAIPKLHLRYGGKNNLGQHILEFGEFDVITSQFTQGINLVDLKLSPLNSTQYSRIVSFGGIGGDTRVTLGDALGDPRYALDPLSADYPILQNPITGDYYIENKLAPNLNSGVTKSFNLTKPDNQEAVTEAFIYEAGFSLWKKSISFLQAAGDYDTYTGTIITQSLPQLCNRAILIGSVYESVYNELTMSDDRVKVFDINNDFKIVKISTKLESYQTVDEFNFQINDDEFLVDFEITSGEEAQEFDDSLELAKDIDNESGIDSTQINPIDFVTVTHNSSEPADCDFNGFPATGKSFTFNMSSIPSWAVAVSWGVVGKNPSNLDYVVVQEPALPSTPLILCIAEVGSTWGAFSGDAIVRVLFSYS